MSNEQEITSVAVPERVASGSLLQVIAQAAVDPRCDVDKMERLLAMQQTIVAEERRTAFMAALARVAAKLPEIGKHGTSHQGKYARLLDVDRAIRPILSVEGLSLSFDSDEMPGEKVRVTCRLSHEQGHSESKQITMPIDKSGNKNGAQAIISTVSYGRRALTKMFFNLMESDGLEDDAGNGGSAAPITEEQARDIRTMIKDTQSDEKKFLKLIAGVDSIESIPARDFRRVMSALEEKQRSMRK